MSISEPQQSQKPPPQTINSSPIAVPNAPSQANSSQPKPTCFKSPKAHLFGSHWRKGRAAKNRESWTRESGDRESKVRESGTQEPGLRDSQEFSAPESRDQKSRAQESGLRDSRTQAPRTQNPRVPESSDRESKTQELKTQEEPATRQARPQESEVQKATAKARIFSLSSTLTPTQAKAILALSALFFGGMAVATRAISGDLGASQIVTVRFLIGLLGVGFISAFRPKAFVATRPGLLLLRGLLGGGAVLGYFIAIEQLNAGLATLLNYTFPLWATLFSALLLKEQLSPQVVLGIGLASLGLVSVVGPAEVVSVLGRAGDPGVRLGLIAALVSSLFAGAAVVTVRVLRQSDSSLAVFGAFCGFGLLVSLPGNFQDWRAISPRAALFLVLVGLLSLAAQLLFTFALRFVPAGTGSLTTQLTVVASYGIAALTLGEKLSPQTAIGSLVVTAGVLLAAGVPSLGVLKRRLPLLQKSKKTISPELSASPGTEEVSVP